MSRRISRLCREGCTICPCCRTIWSRRWARCEGYCGRAAAFVAVEPWLTPFLQAVHFLAERQLVRALSNKFDALATMTQYERPTYEQWLGQPQAIQDLMHKYFTVEQWRCAWGKMMLVGRK